MQKTLLDDPAARVRRWRRAAAKLFQTIGEEQIIACVAENVVSVLRHVDIELARFGLTEAETTAVLEIANAEADREA